MTGRSARVEVRNPVLALPAAGRLMALEPEVRAVVADIFRDLALDAHERAEESWRKKKGPMAAYWKACSVYAKHIRAAIRRGYL